MYQHSSFVTLIRRTRVQLREWHQVWIEKDARWAKRLIEECIWELSNRSSTVSVDGTVAEGGKLGRLDSATDLRLRWLQTWDRLHLCRVVSQTGPCGRYTCQAPSVLLFHLRCHFLPAGSKNVQGIQLCGSWLGLKLGRDVFCVGDSILSSQSHSDTECWGVGLWFSPAVAQQLSTHGKNLVDHMGCWCNARGSHQFERCAGQISPQTRLVDTLSRKWTKSTQNVYLTCLENHPELGD